MDHIIEALNFCSNFGHKIMEDVRDECPRIYLKFANFETVAKFKSRYCLLCCNVVYYSFLFWLNDLVWDLFLQVWVKEAFDD